MSKDYSKTTVVLCDTQPIAAEGLRTLLAADRNLEFSASISSLEVAKELVTARPPNLVIVDKGFGMPVVLDWIHDLKRADAPPAVTVWGVSMTAAEAVRLLRAGAKGIVHKTADVGTILSCLRTVASGRDCVFSDSVPQARHRWSELTARQRQVIELVEQGFKNKEIALELGIHLGTIKNHLSHISQKTGLRGRHRLAMSSLKEREMV